TKGPGRNTVKAAEKGDGIKWTFQTFREVRDQVEQEQKERRGNQQCKKQALFKLQERNLSYGSVNLDKLQ
ncbi:3235_t:CDS:1, partial [Rhizophagus irregularis]